MRTLRVTLAALALAGTTALGGCNLYEGFYDDVAAGDTAALLASADVALQNGDAARAADLYKQATASAAAGSSEQARAASGYATATFAQTNVSVLSIDRIAQDLLRRFDNGSTPQATMPAGLCSFGPPERAGERLDLNTVDGYPALRAAAGTIGTLKTTLAAAYGLPAVPGPGYDAAALAATLRARGLSDNQIGDVLLNLTLAYTATSFDRVAKAGGEQIAWYEVFPVSGDSYLGYCAPSQAVLDQVKREASCSLSDMGFAVTLLKERVRLFPGGSLSADLVAQADESYQRLAAEIGTACN